jgi:hypothetical protein
MLLLESSTFNFRYEEVLGRSTISLGVWGYAEHVTGWHSAPLMTSENGIWRPSTTPPDTGSAGFESLGAHSCGSA